MRYHWRWSLPQMLQWGTRDDLKMRWAECTCRLYQLLHRAPVVWGNLLGVSPEAKLSATAFMHQDSSERDLPRSTGNLQKVPLPSVSWTVKPDCLYFVHSTGQYLHGVLFTSNFKTAHLIHYNFLMVMRICTFMTEIEKDLQILDQCLWIPNRSRACYCVCGMYCTLMHKS